MTRDQYTKVGVAAHDAWEEDAKTNPKPVNPHAYVYGFKAGAQTILDNPQEWGLMPILDSMQAIEDSDSDWEDALSGLKAQLSRYREALEKIANDSGCHLEECIRIAKEALKQQDNDPR